MRSLAVFGCIVFFQFFLLCFSSAQYFHIPDPRNSKAREPAHRALPIELLPQPSTRSGFRLFNPWRVCPVDRFEGEVESFESLRLWVEEHSEVDSLDVFLSCLPEEAFETSSFGFESRAPEGAFVDARHPRVFLSLNRGALILSFTGQLGTEDYEILRALEFNEAEDRFDLHFLTFDVPMQADAVQADASQKEERFQYQLNPDRCLGCHGQDPKPIWGSYRRWDGMFGSSSDAIWDHQNEEQYFQFLQFVDTKKYSSRYQRGIRQHMQRDSWNQRNRREEGEFNVYYPMIPRNFLFTTQLGKLNGKKMVARITEHESFNAYKYLWAATYLRCVLPEEVERNIRHIIQQNFENDPWFHPPRQSSPYQFLMEHVPETPRDRDRQSIARMYFLTELLGVDSSQWDLFFGDEERGWDMKGPGMQMGGDSIVDHSFEFLIPFLLEYEEIQEGLEGYDWSRESLSLHYRQGYREPENFDHVCEVFNEVLVDEMQRRLR